jgi:hypothetical protein
MWALLNFTIQNLNTYKSMKEIPQVVRLEASQTVMVFISKGAHTQQSWR